MAKDSYILPIFDDTAVQPTLIIDSREQMPLQFTRLKSQPGSLQTGDYSIVGCEQLFGVERKSIPDLVQCCTGSNRERFCRELHRLRGHQFKRLMIIGSKSEILTGRYRSGISPQSIMASISAWEIRFDTPVAWIPSPEEASHQIESWACWFVREILKTASTIVDKTKGDYETEMQSAGTDR